MYRVLSLFAGIGGLCHQGIETASLDEKFLVTDFVEANPFRQKVLQHHCPLSRIYPDVKTFKPAKNYDIICGGSPCQDISQANPEAQGLQGDRSGLWREMWRIIATAKPRIVLWENVAGAAHPKRNQPISPLGEVIGSLAHIGYLCQWQSIRLSSLGAAHRRERILLVAHPNGWEQESRGILPPSWSGCIGSQTKELLSEWASKSPPHQAMVNGFSEELLRHVGGWWKANPFDGIESMGRNVIKDRYQKNSAIGDSCSPIHSAIAWTYIYSLLQWHELNKK